MARPVHTWNSYCMAHWELNEQYTFSAFVPLFCFYRSRLKHSAHTCWLSGSILLHLRQECSLSNKFQETQQGTKLYEQNTTHVQTHSFFRLNFCYSLQFLCQTVPVHLSNSPWFFVLFSWPQWGFFLLIQLHFRADSRFHARVRHLECLLSQHVKRICKVYANNFAYFNLINLTALCVWMQALKWKQLFNKFL